MAKGEDPRLKETFQEILHDWINAFVSFAAFVMAIGALCVYKEREDKVLTIPTWFFVIYLILDLAWVLINPKLVKTPKVIIGHHIITLWLCYYPLATAKYGAYGCQILMVELNTTWITLRRRLNHPKWVEVNFYLTWFALRCIMFPLLTLRYCANSWFFGFGTYLAVLVPDWLKTWEQGTGELFPMHGIAAFLLISAIQAQMTFILVRTIVKKGWFAHTPVDDTQETKKKE